MIVPPGRSSTRERASRDLPQQLGRTAESIVSELLRARGYTVLAHNLRLGHYELDILARRGDEITAFEVRYRSDRSWQTALGSISFAKRMHLRAALRSLWYRVKRDPSVARVKLEIAAVTLSTDAVEVEIVPAHIL